MAQDIFKLVNEMFDRSTIGFDVFLPSFIHSEDPFPRINVVKEDKDYVLEVAVAGFNKDNLTVSQNTNSLVIEGKIEKNTEENYIYKGISNRAFRKIIPIATGLKVGGATINDGILKLNLIPEHESVKQISIQ